MRDVRIRILRLAQTLLLIVVAIILWILSAFMTIEFPVFVLVMGVAWTISEEAIWHFFLHS